MQVQIKPRELLKWHGKTEIENFSRPKTIVAAVDPSTMTYKVEFTAQERELLEKTGYDISTEVVPGRPHPTWDGQAGKLVLEPNTIVLDTSNPLDLLKIGIARGANKHIAPSLKAAENDSEFSEATHYIFSEDVELADRVSKISVKQEANKLLYEMTPDRIATVVMLVENVSVKDRSNDFIRAKADEIVERDPKQFLHWAKMNTEDMALFSLVEAAILEGTIEKHGLRYSFLGEDVGFSKADVVENLRKPENQAIKLKLLELSDNRKKKK